MMMMRLAFRQILSERFFARRVGREKEMFFPLLARIPVGGEVINQITARLILAEHEAFNQLCGAEYRTALDETTESVRLFNR